MDSTAYKAKLSITKLIGLAPQISEVSVECQSERSLTVTALDSKASWDHGVLANIRLSFGEAKVIPIRFFNGTEEFGCCELDFSSFWTDFDPQKSSYSKTITIQKMKASFKIEFRVVDENKPRLSHSKRGEKEKQKNVRRHSSKRDKGRPVSLGTQLTRTGSGNLTGTTSEEFMNNFLKNSAVSAPRTPEGEAARPRSPSLSLRSSLGSAPTEKTISSTLMDLPQSAHLTEPVGSRARTSSLRSSLGAPVTLSNKISQPDSKPDGPERSRKSADASRVEGRDIRRVKAHKKALSLDSQQSITDMKQRYAQERQSTAVDFLISYINSNGENDSQMKAYVISRSILHWGPNSPKMIEQIFDTCERKILEQPISRLQLFSWFTTAVSILFFATQELENPIYTKTSSISLKPNFLKDFETKSKALVTTALRTLWDHLISQTHTILLDYMATILNFNGSDKISDCQNSFTMAVVIKKIGVYFSSMSKSAVFPEIKLYFYKKTFRWILGCMLEVLLAADVIYFLQGMQLKVLVTYFIDWARSFDLHDIAIKEFAPAKDVGNLICTPEKHSFLNASERKIICPSLRPSYVSLILSKCHECTGDQISSSFFESLKSQDAEFQATESTFERNSERQEFGFNIQFCNLVDISMMTLPKGVREFPGLEFLVQQTLEKPTITVNQSEATSSDDAW